MKTLRVVFCVALGFSTLCAFGFDAPRGREPLPNFDRRLERAAPAEPAAAPRRQRTADSLAKRVAGLRTDRDPVTQSPKWIGSTRGFLTGAGGEGGA